MTTVHDSSMNLGAVNILILHLMDELSEPDNEELLAELAVQISADTPFFRSLPEQKRVAEFLRSLQRLESGAFLATEDRNQIWEQCSLVQPLIRQLSAAARAFEGRQDDDD